MELTNLDVSSPLLSGQPGAESLEDELESPIRGPPSEASSQEWDKITDPGSQLAS